MERKNPIRYIVPAFALALGAALAAGGCKNDAQRAADQRAQQVQNHADRAADQLRNRADQVERNARESAHDQAQQLRAEADRVRDQGHAQANEVRHDEAAQAPAGNERADEPGARGGGPAVRSAMQAYAEARCEREARCNNVGVGKHYRDRSACVADQTNDRSHSWETANECTGHGVNQAELDECLRAVRADSCGNPFDDVSRLSACRAAEVCRP